MFMSATCDLLPIQFNLLNIHRDYKYYSVKTHRKIATVEILCDAIIHNWPPAGHMCTYDNFYEPKLIRLISLKYLWWQARIRTDDVVIYHHQTFLRLLDRQIVSPCPLFIVHRFHFYGFDVNMLCIVKREEIVVF